MGGAAALLEHLDTTCGGTIPNAVGVERATVLVLLAELHQRCSLHDEADRLLLAARSFTSAPDRPLVFRTVASKPSRATMRLGETFFRMREMPNILSLSRLRKPSLRLSDTGM